MADHNKFAIVMGLILAVYLTFIIALFSAPSKQAERTRENVKSECVVTTGQPSPVVYRVRCLPNTIIDNGNGTVTYNALNDSGYPIHVTVPKRDFGLTRP